MIKLRQFLLSACIAVAAPAMPVAADQYAARYTPVVLTMQKVCADFVLRKTNDGSRLAKVGLGLKRQTNKKKIYQGKAGLKANLDTVYSVEMRENNRGVRGCDVRVIRTNYDTARTVHTAALNDMRKQGGKPVAAPSGGNFAYHGFAFGSTVIQVKSVFSSNSLSMDYYIPR